MFCYRDENFYVIETSSFQNKSWDYKFKACTTSLWLNIKRGIEQVARGNKRFWKENKRNRREPDKFSTSFSRKQNSEISVTNLIHVIKRKEKKL